jgi:hypothetical protein
VALLAFPHGITFSKKHILEDRTGQPYAAGLGKLSDYNRVGFASGANLHHEMICSLPSTIPIPQNLPVKQNPIASPVFTWHQRRKR